VKKKNKWLVSLSMAAPSAKANREVKSWTAAFDELIALTERQKYAWQGAQSVALNQPQLTQCTHLTQITFRWLPKP